MLILPVEDHRTRRYGVHRATETIVDIAALVPSRNSHLLHMVRILATDRYSQMVLRDELLCPLLDVFVLRRKSNAIQTAEMVCHDNHIDAATANDRWGFRDRSGLLLREGGQERMPRNGCQLHLRSAHVSELLRSVCQIVPKVLPVQQCKRTKILRQREEESGSGSREQDQN